MAKRKVAPKDELPLKEEGIEASLAPKAEEEAVVLSLVSKVKELEAVVLALKEEVASMKSSKPQVEVKKTQQLPPSMAVARFITDLACKEADGSNRKKALGSDPRSHLQIFKAPQESGALVALGLRLQDGDWCSAPDSWLERAKRIGYTNSYLDEQGLLIVK